MESISIKAVGDICPGDKGMPGFGVCSLSQKHGESFSLTHVNEVLGGDLVIGNLEGLITQQVTTRGAANLLFCGEPSFAKALSDAGFNVLNVANNHILEHGPEIFQETIGELEKNNINICGLRDDSGKYYSKPVITEKNNLKIGILGYNWVGIDKFTNCDEYIAQSRDSIVNYTWERDVPATHSQENVSVANSNVLKDIRKLKAEVDVVVLITHWGFEFVNYPPYGVTLEAKSFIDAGVDLILGGHPHVLQGMEIYNNGHVFYSFGNFIFDMEIPETKKTAVLTCELSADGVNNWNMSFFKLNNHYQPMPAKGKELENIQKAFDDSCAKIVSDNRIIILDDNDVYRKYEEQYNKGKYMSILYHFRKALTNPKMIGVICRKGLNFGGLMFRRLLGEKVRW